MLPNCARSMCCAFLRLSGSCACTVETMLGGIDDWRRAKKDCAVVVDELLASPPGSVLVGRVVSALDGFVDPSASFSSAPSRAADVVGCASAVVSFSISRWACVTTWVKSRRAVISAASLYWHAWTFLRRGWSRRVPCIPVS